MFWIGFIILMSILVTIGVVKLAGIVLNKVNPIQWDGSVLDVLMDYPRSCFSALAVVICFGLYLFSYQISEMYNCGMRSTVQKVETQYSWYFDSCQFKNKEGVWIDFKQVRGTPDAGTE